MHYISKHWHGELSLRASFFINLCLITICFTIFIALLIKRPPIENPVTVAKILIFLNIMSLFIYPWQVVGVWRSANAYVKSNNKAFWANVVKFLIIFGLFTSIGKIYIQFPIYKDIYKIGFVKDDQFDYELKLVNDNKLIYLSGGLAFGISKQVSNIIEQNPNVEGIILDSNGGRTYEGRALSSIIDNHQLDTYTLSGCYSSCCVAFISGKKRYLGKQANLAFHQYKSFSKNFSRYDDFSREYEKDFFYFKKQGISPDFINKIFKTKGDDLWYPTVAEMLDAGIIHDTVYASEVIPIKPSESTSEYDVADDLLKMSAFKTIKKHEPDIYNKIMNDIRQGVERNLGPLELQEIAQNSFTVIGFRCLKNTSNSAYLAFGHQMLNTLSKLKDIDPIICLKFVFPRKYGAISFERLFTKDEIVNAIEVWNIVITDYYENHVEKIDEVSAKQSLREIRLKLSDGFQYLESQELRSKEEYAKACDSIIKFYQLILSYDDDTAANILHYIFSGKSAG